MSHALIEALIDHRHATGLRYYQIANRAGVTPALLSSFMHGKVVGHGDERLAKIGRYVGLAEGTWEEPA